MNQVGWWLEDAARRAPDSQLAPLFAPAEARSLAEVVAAARRVAGGLAAHGVRPGDVVGVMLPNSLDFAVIALGVLGSGAVLAPLAVPFGRATARATEIVRDAGIRHVIARAGTTVGTAAMIAPALVMAGPDTAPAALDPDARALVQYTSGSTARPKGVALTHRQLLAGVDAIVTGARITRDDRWCTWLPMTHDMGFIGILVCIQAGAAIDFTTPATFVKRPDEWLAAFAARGGTLYAGPCSSYRLLLEAIADPAALDLRRWRIAFNGAEQIDAGVIERFARTFAPAGFRSTAMFPVYGLAEATLAVTFPSGASAPRIAWVDRALLMRKRLARDRTGDGARGVVGVGRPVPGLAVRIAGGVPERHVGEIEIRGPSVMTGYYREVTPSVRDGWLPTGDLGFLDRGELFVTGRTKEVMKLNGESYFPEDVEALVRACAGVRRCVALAVVRDEREAMTVLVEAERGDDAALGTTIRRAVAAGLGLAVEVARVERGAILVTTSGKYQRLAMRDLYERGELATRILE